MDLKKILKLTSIALNPVLIPFPIYYILLFEISLSQLLHKWYVRAFGVGLHIEMNRQNISPCSLFRIPPTSSLSAGGTWRDTKSNELIILHTTAQRSDTPSSASETKDTEVEEDFRRGCVVQTTLESYAPFTSTPTQVSDNDKEVVNS